MSQLALVFRNLEVMIAAGVPIVRAIDFLADSETGKMGDALGDVCKQINSGHRISQAVARNPQVFPPIAVQFLEAGEKGGVLHLAVRNLALYLEKSQRLKNQLVSSLAYPAGIVLASLILVVILTGVVFPREEKFMQEMGKSMPAFSKMAVFGIEVAALAALALTLAVGLCYALQDRLPPLWRHKIQQTVESTLLHLPVLGSVAQNIAVARILDLVYNLLEVGVSLTQTASVASVAGNEVIAERYRHFIRLLKQGEDLETALELANPFPRFVNQLLVVGYEHGRITRMLRQCTGMLEEEVENSLSQFAALLEPAALLVVGVVVGILVVASLLPMLSIVETL